MFACIVFGPHRRLRPTPTLAVVSVVGRKTSPNRRQERKNVERENREKQSNVIVVGTPIETRVGDEDLSTSSDLYESSRPTRLAEIVVVHSFTSGYLSMQINIKLLLASATNLRLISGLKSDEKESPLSYGTSVRFYLANVTTALYYRRVVVGFVSLYRSSDTHRNAWLCQNCLLGVPSSRANGYFQRGFSRFSRVFSKREKNTLNHNHTYIGANTLYVY